MKLFTGLIGFIFAIIGFTVITMYTTWVILYTIEEYAKHNDLSFVVYIEKNNDISNP